MLKDFLKLLVEQNGSNLYLSPGSMPSIKLQGELVQVGKRILSPEDTKQFALKLLARDQAVALETLPEIELAVDEPRVGRFRVNIFKQRNQISLVFTAIKTDIPSCASLRIPEHVQELALAESGLLLFTGSRVTDKASTLAALIDHRNSLRAGHILTIEQPIEFVHKHKHSIINQREIGSDTPSFEHGLEQAIRQAVDVLVIGEINSQETMQRIIGFAQSGQLCFASLHADTVEQALERIISMFPPDQHQQLYFDLSLHTNAIISQRMTPTVKDNLAQTVDLLPASPLVKDLIKAGQSHKIQKIAEAAVRSSSKTLDSVLYKLFKSIRASRMKHMSTEGGQPAAGRTLSATAKQSPKPVDNADNEALVWQVSSIDEKSK